MSKLLPCPFCGASSVDLVNQFNTVYCEKCWAHGPDMDDPRSNAELWNTRPTDLREALSVALEFWRANYRLFTKGGTLDDSDSEEAKTYHWCRNILKSTEGE